VHSYAVGFSVDGNNENTTFTLRLDVPVVSGYETDPNAISHTIEAESARKTTKSFSISRITRKRLATDLKVYSLPECLTLDRIDKSPDSELESGLWKELWHLEVTIDESTVFSRPEFCSTVVVGFGDAGSELIRIPFTVRRLSGLTAMPSELDFGSVKIGADAAKRVLVVNNNARHFRILDASCPDNCFTCTQVADESNGRVFVVVHFRPKGPASHRSEVAVKTSEGGAVLRIAVAGRSTE
jgi:hypothetical protein